MKFSNEDSSRLIRAIRYQHDAYIPEENVLRIKTQNIIGLSNLLGRFRILRTDSKSDHLDIAFENEEDMLMMGLGQ